VHELATVLAFSSGVDMVDFYRSFRMNTNNMRIATTPDLFRYSRTSLGYGAGVMAATASGNRQIDIAPMDLFALNVIGPNRAAATSVVMPVVAIATVPTRPPGSIPRRRRPRRATPRQARLQCRSRGRYRC